MIKILKFHILNLIIYRIPENNRLNKYSEETLDLYTEIDKKEIREFFNTTTKEEKHNDIYYHIECVRLLNIEQNEELIENKNLMNYINSKKEKKQKLRIFNLNNPILSESRFANSVVVGEAATLNQTINSCLILLGLVVCSAEFAWTSASSRSSDILEKYFLFSIFALFIALVTCFKKEWSGVTAPLYAVFEGLTFDAISRAFEMRYPGIVFQAVSINANIPKIEAYKSIFNIFYRNYVIGFLKKKYIKEKKLLFFQKKKLFKIFNYFLEIVKKIERLKIIYFK